MKKILIIISVLLGILCLTGCNKQILDFDYTYNYAICNIDGEYQKIKIRKWTDYEGEQLQITDTEDKVYLVSSINCTLVKE